jgi:hypothetical protein
MITYPTSYILALRYLAVDKFDPILTLQLKCQVATYSLRILIVIVIYFLRYV